MTRNRLIAALADPDEQVRHAAAEAIVRFGPNAVQPLTAALTDSNPVVRRAAAVILGRLADPTAIKPLILALTDSDEQVRHAAASALVQNGPIVIEPVIEALAHPNSNVRQQAALVLGQLSERRAMSPLILALRDPEREVRRAAAKALLRLSATEGDSPMGAAARDEREGVAAAASNIARSCLHELDSTTANDKRPVHLGVSAPRRVRRGQEFTARFVAYHPALSARAADALQQPGTDARPEPKIATLYWKKGVQVTLRASGSELLITPPQHSFSWSGDFEQFDFDVSVRRRGFLADIKELLTQPRRSWLKVEVEIAGFVVACPRIDLVICSKWAPPRVEEMHSVRQCAARSAFASYSSEDRMRVLDRVAGLKSLAGLEVFMDCLSMHPGEVWKPLIEHEILTRELFLLFWSKHAKASPWVEWEWTLALDSKPDAQQSIRIQPLEPFPEAPPPERLAHLQFADPDAYQRHYLEMRAHQR